MRKFAKANLCRFADRYCMSCIPPFQVEATFPILGTLLGSATTSSAASCKTLPDGEIPGRKGGGGTGTKEELELIPREQANDELELIPREQANDELE